MHPNRGFQTFQRTGAIAFLTLFGFVLGHAQTAQGILRLEAPGGDVVRIQPAKNAAEVILNYRVSWSGDAPLRVQAYAPLVLKEADATSALAVDTTIAAASSETMSGNPTYTLAPKREYVLQLHVKNPASSGLYSGTVEVRSVPSGASDPVSSDRRSFSLQLSVGPVLQPKLPATIRFIKPGFGNRAWETLLGSRAGTTRYGTFENVCGEPVKLVSVEGALVGDDAGLASLGIDPRFYVVTGTDAKLAPTDVLAPNQFGHLRLQALAETSPGRYELALRVRTDKAPTPIDLEKVTVEVSDPPFFPLIVTGFGLALAIASNFLARPRTKAFGELEGLGAIVRDTSTDIPGHPRETILNRLAKVRLDLQLTADDPKSDTLDQRLRAEIDDLRERSKVVVELSRLWTDAKSRQSGDVPAEMKEMFVECARRLASDDTNAVEQADKARQAIQSSLSGRSLPEASTEPHDRSPSQPQKSIAIGRIVLGARPALMILNLLALTVYGFWTQYVQNPTFGANGLADYFNLGLWGFGAGVVGRSLAEAKLPIP